MIHSAATLRYFLLEGRARLEPLRVFDSRSVSWQGHLVTFCVLGTSHAVVVERGEAALTELLTCAPGHRGATVLEQRAASANWSATHKIDHLRYDCRLSRFALGGDNPLRGTFAPGDRLAFTYKMEHGSEPMTRIGWRADDETLSVETVHTYPHDGVGIRSESEFRVAVSSRGAQGLGTGTFAGRA